MPYKHIEKKIRKEDDRRRKLTDNQRQKIKELYGTISQRKLAAMFNVSRRLITFIGDPLKKKRDLELRQLRGGWKQYYNKEKWKNQMRNHRQYKQVLFLENKLK